MREGGEGVREGRLKGWGCPYNLITTEDLLNTTCFLHTA